MLFFFYVCGSFNPALIPPYSFLVEIDTDQLYDEIYEPEFHGKLSQPIPLPQLIDFLVDVWDSDGI